jgi:hypothetical protein
MKVLPAGPALWPFKKGVRVWKVISPSHRSESKPTRMRHIICNGAGMVLMKLFNDPDTSTINNLIQSGGLKTTRENGSGLGRYKSLSCGQETRVVFIPLRKFT